MQRDFPLRTSDGQDAEGTSTDFLAAAGQASIATWRVFCLLRSSPPTIYSKNLAACCTYIMVWDYLSAAAPRRQLSPLSDSFDSI